MRSNEFITENMNAEKVISTAKRMYDLYKDHTYTAAQRADDHAMGYESNTPQYRYWSQVAHEIHRLEKLGNQDVDETKKRKRKKNRTPRSITTGWWGGYFGDSGEGGGGGVEESVDEDTYVYHASYLPDLAKGLRSVITRGLVPSKDGYYGPGVYFAYRPEDCYYHVDKKNATMFRATLGDLKKLYGVYPENKDGIQSDGEQIVIPGRVPPDLLEIEYFEDEWWDLRDALSAESRNHFDEGHVTEAEQETPAAEEIYSTLERNGYNLIGSGVDATVWAKKDSRDVLKIIMPQHGRGAGREAETFYKFYEFCKQHQNLENLPRFVQIGGDAHSVFTADGRDYVMIGMERLKPIPQGSFAEAMVWILSDLATHNISWEEAWDTIRSEKTWDNWEMVHPDDQQYRTSDPMSTRDVLYNIDSWDKKDSVKWSVLYSLMKLLYHTGRINKQAWDLHTENAMVRGDDMIVITDPWIAQGVE